MASDVEIANRALVKAGVTTRIVALNENSNSARLVLGMWETVRRDELARYRWIFAIKRVQLAASSTAPAFGWSLQYPIPADCLRVLRVGTDGLAEDRGRPFDMEGRLILSDEPAPLSVRYIADITDTGLYDPTFVEVLSCRLARELAKALTESGALVESTHALYRDSLADARRSNAIQRPPQYIGGTEPWLEGRRGYTGGLVEPYLWGA